MARKITGREIPAVVGPRRPGDPATLIASAEAANEDLGWAPRFSYTGTTSCKAPGTGISAHPTGYREENQASTAMA